ncbi:MAG: hypothetical protein IJD23_07195 [Spirochaetaceae bacterium]|nr:hypothetical protein [Spirochaetaceae bacterium]
MKNKIFIIFISLMYCSLLLSCSGFFNNIKTKVSVGDVILSNGYRVPVDYVEDFYWDYLSNNDVLGIVYSIPADGSYMVMCPNPKEYTYHNSNTSSWFVGRYYDSIDECYYTLEIPYLWEIGDGDSCGIDNWDVLKSEFEISDSNISLFPVFSYMKNFNDYMFEKYKYFTSGWYVPTWNEIKEMDVNIINKVYEQIFNQSDFSGTYWLSNMITDNYAKTFYVQSVMEHGETVYKLLEDSASVTDYNSVIFVRNFEDLDESKICFSFDDYQKFRDDEE